MWKNRQGMKVVAIRGSNKILSNPIGRDMYLTGMQSVSSGSDLL